MIAAEYLDLLDVPGRAPFQQETDIDRASTDYERSAFAHWLPTDDEPGMLVAQQWPHEKYLFYSLAKTHYDRLDRLHRLAEMGLRPALEAAGLAMQRLVVQGQALEAESTLYALTIPPPEAFCADASAFLEDIHPPDNPEMSLRFVPYAKQPPHYSPQTLAEALAQRSVPIATADKAVGYHDVVEHATAWLALPPQVISHPAQAAQQRLQSTGNPQWREKNLRHLMMATEICIGPETLYDMVVEKQDNAFWSEFLGTTEHSVICQESLEHIRSHLTNLPLLARRAGYLAI